MPRLEWLNYVHSCLGRYAALLDAMSRTTLRRYDDPVTCKEVFTLRQLAQKLVRNHVTKVEVRAQIATLIGQH